MRLKSLNLLNALSMRQRRTSTEPSQSYSSSDFGPQQPTQSLSAAPIRLIEFTPWLVRQTGPTGTRSAIYFIRGWSGGFGLDEFQIAPYGMKSMSEKGWDVIAPKIRECQPAMSYDTVPGAAAFIWLMPGNSRWPIKKRTLPLWLIVPTSGPRRGANGSPKSISTRSGPPTIRDRSAARVYRPFLRLGMDRCKRAPLNG